MNTRYTPTILILLLGAVLAPASAQPVLTADNFPQPLLGQQVAISQYEADDPAGLSSVVTTTGENQTWDLSGASFGDPLTSTFEYLEPPFDDLPGWVVFQNADPQPNFAYQTFDVIDPEEFPDPVQLAFYTNVNESRIINLGFAGMFDFDQNGEPDEVVFSNVPGEVQFTFPTSFGDEWTQSYEQSFNAIGVAQFTSQITTVDRVVGYGTLVTPLGSVEVLQIEEERTSTSFGFATTIRSFQFVAPFQEVAGKSQLMSIHANVSLGLAGEVTSVSFSTIELGGGGDPTAAEDLDEIPSDFEIHQNFPNPFNPSTMIEYSLDQTGDVLMTVHDMLGREVAVVVDGVVSAGRHSVRWNAGNLPSGLYQVRMIKDGEVKARSMVLQK